MSVYAMLQTACSSYRGRRLFSLSQDSGGGYNYDSTAIRPHCGRSTTYDTDRRPICCGCWLYTT